MYITEPSCEPRTECEDPTEDVFKKHPCSILGNEACSKNVHTAKRTGRKKDEMGEAIEAHREHDFTLKSGTLGLDCKAKGISYRPSRVYR